MVHACVGCGAVRCGATLSRTGLRRLTQLTITTTGLVGMVVFNLIKGRTLCEFIAKPDNMENVRLIPGLEFLLLIPCPCPYLPITYPLSLNNVPRS